MNIIRIDPETLGDLIEQGKINRCIEIGELLINEIAHPDHDSPLILIDTKTRDCVMIEV
jgi:hypothetical protein